MYVKYWTPIYSRLHKLCRINDRSAYWLLYQWVGLFLNITQLQMYHPCQVSTNLSIIDFSSFPFSSSFSSHTPYIPFRCPLLSCCSLLSIYEAVDENKREKCLRSVWYLRIRKKVSSFPFPPISQNFPFQYVQTFPPSLSILALTLEFTRDKKKYNRKGFLDTLGHRSNLLGTLFYVVCTGGWNSYSGTYRTGYFGATICRIAGPSGRAV